MSTVIVTGCVAGEFGKTLIFTCKDTDGVVQDISAYTGTKKLYCRSPLGDKDVSVTLSFVTTGSDGKVSGAFASGDLDRAGDWEAQVELKISTTAICRSDPFILRVSGGLT